MVEMENIRHPYLFQIIDQNAYDKFVSDFEEKSDEEIKDSSAAITDAIYRANAAFKNMSNMFDRIHDLKNGKEIFAKITGKKTEYFYVQLLCGLTFKPVVSYKVSEEKYSEKFEEVAKVAVKACAIGLSLVML